MLYYFYTLLTAPGVVAHELGHLIFCLTAGVKVHRVKLFGFGRTAGYVVHDEPREFFQGFLISFGPFLFNSLGALFLFSLYQPPYFSWRSILFLWLGFCLALHAIPSTGDARALFQLANRRLFRNPLAVIGYPFVLLLVILNFLKRLRVDILYTALLYWLGNIYLKII